MKQIQMELFAERKQEFMYLKSDSDSEQDISQASPLHKSVTGKGAFQLEESALRKAFPELLCGDAFLDRLAKWTEPWEKYHALMVRLDPVEGVEDAPPDEEAMLVAAEVADDVCDSLGGFWGILRADCLGCAVETPEASEAMLMAENIRDGVKNKSGKTVSIGIAGYPLLSYGKSDILGNARKALDHAALSGPASVVEFDAVSLNISGDKLYQKGDMVGAVKEFESALRLDPENVNVMISLGVCHGVNGEHDKALEEFQKAIKLDPDDVMAPYNAGLIYMMTKERDKALDFFLKAYNLDDTRFEVALQLGRFYLEEKEHWTALHYLEKAAGLEKESGPVHRLLGECHRELNIIDDAIKSYSEAVKLNGNDAYSLSALGGLYAEQGKNMEIALVFCRQSVDLAPQNASFRNRLATVYSKLGQYEEALEEFKRASEIGCDCESSIRETEQRLAAVASCSESDM